ncbi:hypothetical protein M5K25_007714 [Dendrobium thyrsiflorum]|uniref:Uncharacterized protein n=1 Tax=Dendrobium thyrsiflorum TaxID=117978 RepID=A0ABD0VF04_DENTH
MPCHSQKFINRPHSLHEGEGGGYKLERALAPPPANFRRLPPDFHPAVDHRRIFSRPPTTARLPPGRRLPSEFHPVVDHHRISTRPPTTARLPPGRRVPPDFHPADLDLERFPNQQSPITTAMATPPFTATATATTKQHPGGVSYSSSGESHQIKCI